MSNEPTSESDPADLGAMIQLLAAGAGGVAGAVFAGPILVGLVVAATALTGLGALLSSRDFKRLRDKIEREARQLQHDLKAVKDKLNEQYLTTGQARLLAGKWWKTVIEEFRQKKLDAARRILVGDYVDADPTKFLDDEQFFNILEEMNEDHLKLLSLLSPDGLHHSMGFEQQFQRHAFEIDDLAWQLHRLGLIKWSADSYIGLHETQLFRSPMPMEEYSPPDPRSISDAIRKAIEKTTTPSGGYSLSRLGAAFADRLDPSRLEDPKRWYYRAKPWKEMHADDSGDLKNPGEAQ
ncbi:MAG: hypothetical protein IT462_08690 [Planctomycetes bacterium]|nr:hypothetical protein [Planctomycetota bacterium]